MEELFVANYKLKKSKNYLDLFLHINSLVIGYEVYKNIITCTL